jgi:hypothetical protein
MQFIDKKSLANEQDLLPVKFFEPHLALVNPNTAIPLLRLKSIGKLLNEL